VFSVQDEAFDFGAVIEKIRALGDGIVIRVKITAENIVEIFNGSRQGLVAPGHAEGSG
jgi:hypothetical protein